MGERDFQAYKRRRGKKEGLVASRGLSSQYVCSFSRSQTVAQIYSKFGKFAEMRLRQNELCPYDDYILP